MIDEDILIRKVNALPPGKIDEVIDFIDFLAFREATAWRAKRTASIAEFAAEFGGTDIDLDEDFEAAAIDSFLSIDEASR